MSLQARGYGCRKVDFHEIPSKHNASQKLRIADITFEGNNLPQHIIIEGVRKEVGPFLHRLPEPFIVMGDFNARHALWCDRESNTCGRLLERVLFDEPVSVLNNAGPTHIDPRTKTETCIDLTLCSNTVTLDFSWNIQGFLYNSDHFPICLNFNDPVEVELQQRWHFQNADWKRFANLAILDDMPEFFNDIDDMITFFISLVLNAATLCIKRTSVFRSSLPFKKCNVMIYSYSP